MALMKCPECGGQVSDKAHFCPHCGYPEELLRASASPAEEGPCLFSYQGKTYDVSEAVRYLREGERGEAGGLLWEQLDLRREEVIAVLNAVETAFLRRA